MILVCKLVNELKTSKSIVLFTKLFSSISQLSSILFKLSYKCSVPEALETMTNDDTDRFLFDVRTGFGM